MTNFVAAQDGTQIFYRDIGSGRPIVLSHGWPLNSDAWDPQVQFLADAGFRVVAYAGPARCGTGGALDGRR